MQLYVRVIECKNGHGGYHRNVQLSARPFPASQQNVYREGSYNIHNANWMISTLNSLKKEYELRELDASFSFSLPLNPSITMDNRVTISSGIQLFDLFTAEQNEAHFAPTSPQPVRLRIGKK